MKRVLALILTLALALPVLVFAVDVDLSKLSDEELSRLGEAVAAEQQSRLKAGGDYLLFATYEDMNIALSGVEVLKDGDKRVLVIKYDFSHSADEAVSSVFAARFTVYQDGQELVPALFYEHPSFYNLATEVQQGQSIEVSKGFYLVNESPVEIHVGKFVDLTGAPPDIVTVELPK